MSPSLSDPQIFRMRRVLCSLSLFQEQRRASVKDVDEEVTERKWDDGECDPPTPRNAHTYVFVFLLVSSWIFEQGYELVAAQPSLAAPPPIRCGTTAAFVCPVPSVRLVASLDLHFAGAEEAPSQKPWDFTVIISLCLAIGSRNTGRKNILGTSPRIDEQLKSRSH